MSNNPTLQLHSMWLFFPALPWEACTSYLSHTDCIDFQNALHSASLFRLEDPNLLVIPLIEAFHILSILTFLYCIIFKIGNQNSMQCSFKNLRKVMLKKVSKWPVQWGGLGVFLFGFFICLFLNVCAYVVVVVVFFLLVQTISAQTCLTRLVKFINISRWGEDLVYQQGMIWLRQLFTRNSKVLQMNILQKGTLNYLRRWNHLLSFVSPCK